MPSFSCPSSIRVASQDHVLRLKITHNLVYGLPSETVRNIKGRLPKELDVLWLSDVAISFSGSLDGQQIAAHDVAHSGLVHHLETRLKNVDQLGLNNVSHPFIDDADGLAKLTVTPSRPLPRAPRPHVNLVSLQLAYIWRTTRGRCDVVNSDHLAEEMNPFSSALFLPAEVLLNRVTEQFLIYHLVGRYPLIFGPWCKKLDLEMQYFPSIGRSVVEIMTRSNNQRFLSKCRRLIKVARRHCKFVIQSCTAALSSCTDDDATETSEQGTDDDDDNPAAPVLTDERVLCEGLEELFRGGVARRRFKPAAMLQFAPLQDDDDKLLPCLMPAEEIDDEGSWNELPENLTSPCAPLLDPSEMLAEEMDIFANENWAEDGTWNLRDADTSVDELDFDAESDESLINVSAPLASITTRSMQAFSFALYHHLDVDNHEPDPAACGSYDTPQFVHLDESGAWGLFENLTHSPSHGLHSHQTYEQVTQDLGMRQARFETLDPGCSEGEDSDWILSDMEETVCAKDVISTDGFRT